MSDKTKGRIWEIDLPHNEKWVLLALADHADHQGRNIYPGHDLIAYKTDLHEKTVVRLVQRLLARGILRLADPARRPSPSNPYHIEWSACTFKPPFERAERGRPKRSSDPLPLSPREERSNRASPHFGKRSSSGGEKKESGDQKEVAFDQKEGVPPHAGQPLNHRTIKEPDEPHAFLSPTDEREVAGPQPLTPCRYPGCPAMLPAREAERLPFCEGHRRAAGAVIPFRPRK
jgi:hypothetical protein